MEEIFGVDTNRIVVGVAVGFALIVGAVGLLALLNRIILKIGLRNIPRRPAQTALIVVGLMLSTLIISSALGTGDTINHSIRSEVTKGLGEIDEILTSAAGDSVGLTGSSPYFPTCYPGRPPCPAFGRRPDRWTNAHHRRARPCF